MHYISQYLQKYTLEKLYVFGQGSEILLNATVFLIFVSIDL